MRGWKTWTAALVSIGYGVEGYLFGMHEATQMMEMVLGGLALIGIGHKLEKGPER